MLSTEQMKWEETGKLRNYQSSIAWARLARLKYWQQPQLQKIALARILCYYMIRKLLHLKTWELNWLVNVNRFTFGALFNFFQYFFLIKKLLLQFRYLFLKFWNQIRWLFILFYNLINLGWILKCGHNSGTCNALFEKQERDISMLQTLSILSSNFLTFCFKCLKSSLYFTSCLSNSLNFSLQDLMPLSSSWMSHQKLVSNLDFYFHGVNKYPKDVSRDAR